MLLNEAFSNYLSAHRSGTEIGSLIEILNKYNFKFYSEILQCYLKNGLCSFTYNEHADWKNLQVGLTSPENPHPGDLWFDILELTPYVFVPNSEDWSQDAKGWYALSPVYTWQYRAFIKKVEYEYKRSESTYIDMEIPDKYIDFFNPSRVSQLREEDYVTNVFQDEAKAYVAWWGKYLLDEKMVCAKAFLPEQKLSMMIPPPLSLWDYSDFEGEEKTALAFNLTTVEYEDTDELIRFSGRDKVVYKKHEVSSYVGFSSFINTKGIYKTSGFVYPYIQLKNFAPDRV